MQKGKGKRGRYVAYLFRYRDGKELWKNLKSLNEEEKLACKKYRDKLKAAEARYNKVAKSMASAAENGNQNEILNLFTHYTFDQIGESLAVHVNMAKIREDQDIGDWGNVKNTVHLYEHTPLVKAVLRTDVTAVFSLLSTGLCDPTLQSCMRDYIMDTYTIPESVVDTAIKIARTQREKHESIEKIHDANKIEMLINEALKMWPTAKECSPITSYGGTRKYENRMYGVFDANSQNEMTLLLRKKLTATLERYSQIPEIIELV